MRLEQLKYFVATADAGAISAAAQRLGISQPAVSAAVRSLEKELGGMLLRRGNSGVSLTPLGRLTYRDARRMLELAQTMRARGRNEDVEGSVSVCARPMLSFHLTSGIVLPFKKMHPRADVFIHNVSGMDIIADLKSGRSNIAVTLVSVGLNIREQARDLGCEIVPLYTDTRKIFIGSGHPLAQKKELTAEDLKSLRIAYYSHSQDYVSSRYAPYFGGEYRLATRDDILDLVIRNEAVFIQAGAMFQHDYRVRKGMMVARNIPLKDIDHRAPIVAIRTPEISLVERLFWEFLLENFSATLQSGQSEQRPPRPESAAR